MLFDLDDLRTRLLDAGLARVVDELVEAATGCISITTHQRSDESIPIGASKIGGEPDLPAGVEWPHCKNAPLSFACQFNLSSVPANSSAGRLPSEGLLSFFCDTTQFSHVWHVQLFSKLSLARIAFPETLPDYLRY